MKIGVIGDDFTGSSDIGNTLARQGFRTALFPGQPGGAVPEGLEAGIIALKIRTVPARQAIDAALDALDWLRASGARQFIYKICSTFDSTDDGNIGPVTEALADRLDARCVAVCPAFPGTGRTVYQGHLFVGDRLLSDTGMASHPLTPMTDPDLRRVLARQSRSSVGHLALGDLRQDPDTAAQALQAQCDTGNRLVICDAIDDEDLQRLGEAASSLPLMTGGSGLALGLRHHRARTAKRAPNWTGVTGPVAALAGSVSEATRKQVEAHRGGGHPVRSVTPSDVMENPMLHSDLADWVMAEQASGVPLVATTAAPDTVAEAQARYGRDVLADRIEQLFSALAVALTERGVKRLILAGGETSGAAVSALEPGAMEIGPEIDPGIPALFAAGPGLGLALKSGNFGGMDFFERAARLLEEGQ